MGASHGMAEAAAGAAMAGKAVASAGAQHTIFAMGSGLTMATIVVMAMTMPKNKIDFFCALLSTVASSVFGGAWAIQYFGLLEHLQSAGSELDTILCLARLGGIFFAFGLPGWIIIRACFVWSESRKHKGIDQIIKDARDTL